MYLARKSRDNDLDIVWVCVCMRYVKGIRDQPTLRPQQKKKTRRTLVSWAKLINKRCPFFLALSRRLRSVGIMVCGISVVREKQCDSQRLGLRTGGR